MILYNPGANGEFILQVLPWDETLGQFTGVNVKDSPRKTCIRRTAGLLPLTSSGDRLWLGQDATANNRNFRGGLDNLVIYNYVGDPSEYGFAVVNSSCTGVTQ